MEIVPAFYPYLFSCFIRFVKECHQAIVIDRFTIDPRETPVQTSLMLMMSRAILSNETFTIRGCDGMQIGPVFGTGVLNHYWFILITPEN